ncbi:MAG: cobalamin adenosyltransferase [Acidobacteria bacterium RIFCSPLOWO2_02_FULL_60_20]|nr:MAG: cobalamin adenosyltransferase [Acidobacteria bacterium RIFCSPLOWO2_02_FULL_60_20]
MANTITRTTLSAEAAKKMIAAAEAKAEEMKRTMVISICDEGGNLKAFSRMDGAPLLSIQLAQDKAWTSVSYGVSTDQWFEFIKNDPPLLHGIVNTPRLVVFGGGFPIKIEKQLVGGIGVSGGHWKEDMEVAQAGLKALAG